MERLVLTVARGKPEYAEMALGLGRSLSLIGDLTPRAIVTDIPDYDFRRVFDMVIPAEGPFSFLGWLDALEATSARSVLVVDSDMLAFDRLDRIFERCRDLPFAVQGQWVSEGTWYGSDLSAACRHLGVGRFPKFNAGFLYVERTPAFDRLVEAARRVEADYDAYGFNRFRGRIPDEICIAIAMAQTGVGDVVPETLNFMGTGAGIIGRLHMDVRRGQCWYLARRERVRLIRPILFHAWYFRKFWIYWRQLVWLRRLEKLEDRTVPRQTPRWRRIQRSIERRTLWWYRRQLGP